MARCKECIHYEVCENGQCYETTCVRFKNKADFVEVKHGKWIKNVVEKHGIHRPTFICSKCGKRRFVLADYNYCPNCGAKMDGEKHTENTRKRTRVLKNDFKE